MQDPITIVLESGPTPWWEVALAVGSLLAAIGAAWAAVFAAGVAQRAATIASEARVDPMAVELYRAQADAARSTLAAIHVVYVKVRERMQQEGEPTSVRTDDEGLDEAEVVLTGAEALLPNDVVQASYRAMYMLARTRNPEGFIADWPGGPDEAVGAIGTQLQRLVDVAREHLQVTPLTRQTRELASSVRGGGHESS